MTQVVWRPDAGAGQTWEMAVASEDGSVRVYSFNATGAGEGAVGK